MLFFENDDANQDAQDAELNALANSISDLCKKDTQPIPLHPFANFMIGQVNVMRDSYSLRVDRDRMYVVTILENERPIYTVSEYSNLFNSYHFMRGNGIQTKRSMTENEILLFQIKLREKGVYFHNETNDAQEMPSFSP